MEWYRLKMAGIKDSVIIKLMKEFDSYQEIFMLDRDKFKQYFKFADEVINSIYDSRNRDFSKEEEKLKNLGIKVISIVDDEYPVFLKIFQVLRYFYITEGIFLLQILKK